MPSQPFLLVDGYNLLHAAGFARRRYGPGDLQRSRSRLLTYLLLRLSEEQLSRTTVVFDAENAPSNLPRSTSLHGMEVLFADPGTDADSKIEQLIAQHSAPRQIRVVSSDHRLQKAARRRRCRFVDSEAFVIELEKQDAISGEDEQVTQRMSQHPKYTGRLSETETQQWLEFFGEVPRADSKGERLQSEIDELTRDFDVES